MVILCCKCKNTGNIRHIHYYKFTCYTLISHLHERGWSWSLFSRATGLVTADVNQDFAHIFKIDLAFLFSHLSNKIYDTSVWYTSNLMGMFGEKNNAAHWYAYQSESKDLKGHVVATFSTGKWNGRLSPLHLCTDTSSYVWCSMTKLCDGLHKVRH